MKILIVEDSRANLAVLRQYVEQFGATALCAESGETALQLYEQNRPDLILLDIVLPGMDGMEACRRLKAHPATCNIPVIFMSARTDTDDIVAGFDAGAADYIPKPLRLAEVCARVRSQLQLRRAALSQQQQSERLRLIVNSMDEGLMTIEPGGRIQYANPACERYLGYSHGELAGRPLGELLVAPVAQECLDFFDLHMTRPAPQGWRGAGTWRDSRS